MSAAKLQEVVDYLGAVGMALLSDDEQLFVASGSGLVVPEFEVPKDAPLVASAPLERSVRIGSYTLTVYPAPGVSWLAVTQRLDRAASMLRLVPDAMPGLTPPKPSGGAGPASSELRVWPPKRRWN